MPPFSAPQFLGTKRNAHSMICPRLVALQRLQSSYQIYHMTNHRFLVTGFEPHLATRRNIEENRTVINEQKNDFILLIGIDINIHWKLTKVLHQRITLEFPFMPA